MGLFKTKTRHPLDGLTPRDLKQGTQIGLVDVDPGFIAFVRETKPRIPRLGHETVIALVPRGADVFAYYDDHLVGRLDPEATTYYADEFATLERRKQFGRTMIYIKPEGAKTPHSVGLNWGVGAQGGGIL